MNYSTAVVAYGCLIVFICCLSIGSSLWVLSGRPKLPINAFTKLIFLQHILDLIMSVGIIVFAVGTIVGTLNGYQFVWNSFGLLMFHLITFFIYNSLTMSLLSFYIVKLNGSIKKVCWKTVSLISLVPGSSFLFWQILSNPNFSYRDSFSTAVKYNLIATVGALFTMTALYAITFEELRLQNQKLEPAAARQKGSRAMMRLIIAFTTANTCIWAPFIIFVAMSVMFSVKRDMGVIVLNASPGILVLAIIFQILFSSKGIVYGFSIWWYVKGVKKQNQRIAIPIQIFHEHMPVSESSNNTCESTTNPSQNYIPPSTIRQLSLMGVDIPDHLAVYSKAALNSSMQHFPDSPDHSLESSFMPYESYIIHEPALYQVPSPTCNSDGTATEDNSHCEYPLPAAK